MFHGPLQLFGKLLYRQMVLHGSKDGGKGDQIKDRITLEQFTKAGKELLKMFDEGDQHRYYFQLFAAGKDHLTKEGIKNALESLFLKPLKSQVLDTRIIGLIILKF